MQRSNSVRLKISSFSLYSSLFLVSVSGLLLPGAAMAQATNEPVIYLDQAWWQDDREWYYHFSQGSAVLSYDIFMNLEAAGSQDLFRFDANSARYGPLPEPANAYNPDGLPIVGKGPSRPRPQFGSDGS